MYLSRKLIKLGLTLFAIFVGSLLCFVRYTTRSNDAYSAVSEQTIRDTRNYDSGRNVTLIIGRPPHRIHLDDNLRVDKIHIAIRTTAKFHHSKMDPLLLTWLQTATPSNVYIVTDHAGGENHNASEWTRAMSDEFGFNFISTQCPDTKDLVDLHCKTATESESYYAAVEAGKKYEWYCHFDDDVYVNLPLLTKDLLLKYNPYNESLYFGQSYGYKYQPKKKELKGFHLKGSSYFEFACGFGHCMSAKLMKEMEPYFRGENFMRVASAINRPEDNVIGFIIESLLGVKVKRIKEFHSHVEVLQDLDPQTLHKQITVGFGRFSITQPKPPDKYPPTFFRGTPTENHVTIPNATFNATEDPTRLLSYHCLLYPETNWCHPSYTLKLRQD